jgi:hypothetical protein
VVAIFQKGTSLLENMMFSSESPVMQIKAYASCYIPNWNVFLHIQGKFTFGNSSETIFSPFDICGSVLHYLINKTTNLTQLAALVFIIPWKVLYMFRVLFAPIIRSVLKLYMQLLVQSCVGTKCCTLPTSDHLVTDRM